MGGDGGEAYSCQNAMAWEAHVSGATWQCRMGDVHYL